MHNLIRWIGITIAVLGVVVCLGAIIAGWVYYPSTVEKIESVYSQVDDVLMQAEERIHFVGEKVHTVNELTANYQVDLRNWAETEKNDEDHFGHRAEIVVARIQQLQEGLDFAETLILNAQKLTVTFRKKRENTPLKSLLNELAELKTIVAKLVESANKIGLENDDPTIREKIEERIEKALSEVVHAITLFETADQRLQNLEDKVQEVHQKSSNLEHRLLRDLWWGRIVLTIYMIWMAIGQVALGTLAWCYGSSGQKKV